MEKTARKYLDDIAEKSSLSTQLVFVDLAHYLNVRTLQVKHYQWLKDNKYIVCAHVNAKRLKVGLTEKGINFLK